MTPLEWWVHQAAQCIVFFVVHNQDSTAQQTGHRIALGAPSQLVAVGNEQLAIGLRSHKDGRAKTKQGDLERLADVLIHQRERSQQ